MNKTDDKNNTPPDVLQMQLQLTQLDAPVEFTRSVEDILLLLSTFCKEMPEIKQGSRVVRYVMRWETKVRWLELRLVVGDHFREEWSVIEKHLVGANFNKMSFRTYINGISEADARSAFEWLYQTVDGGKS